MATMAPAEPQHPVSFDIACPEQLNRWLVFVKWLLIIPHLIVAGALLYAAELLVVIAWFAILFTGKWPEGMFKFTVGCLRWQYNVNAYSYLQRDEYPPFSFDPGQYAVAFDVAYPEKLNRWLIFVKWLLILPNIFVLALFSFVWIITIVIAWFAILFTGQYPRGLFDFSVGVQRWSARATAYAFLMTDKYPPFGTGA